MEQEKEDKLQAATDAVRANPDITDEQLAQILGLSRPASARFWRLKAYDALGMSKKEEEPTTQRPDDFAEQFQKNPAAAYVNGLNQAIARKQRERAAQKGPGFFARLFDRLFPPSPVNNNVLPDDEDLDESEVTTLKYPTPKNRRLSTSTMTPEQLRTRRMNLIEGSKFGRPAHEAFMLFILRGWLIVGPIAFVALTTSEVAYILTSLTPPGDTSSMIIWGGALFIDLAMMFTTFGVAIKRRDLAEKREANGGILAKREEAEIWFGTLMWITFAAINIIGQAAFLLHIIQAGGSGDMNILYIFVASRVVGFILGDASTAFFLAKVDNSHLKLLARSEREKAALYSDIAKAEGERRLIEAKAEADITLLQIEVQQKQEDAHFLADLKRQAFADALNRHPALPEPDSGPNKSRLRRLD